MRNTIGYILQFTGLAIIFFPVYMWIRHPELTEMQVFLNYWWLIMLGIAIGAGGMMIKNKS